MSDNTAVRTGSRASRLANIDSSVLGMALFLVNETVFFGLLIIAYITYRNTLTAGPTAANSLDPLTTFFFSLALFASSFTIWRADKSIEGRITRG